MSDAQTLAVYAAKIDDYRTLTKAPPARALLRFIAAMPKGGQVLDLGCGPGFAAAEMARQGLSVTATDASPEMAAAAAAHAGVTARCEAFTALPRQASYHGIYANFSLLHAPRAEFAAHIAACAAALHPGGILHLGLKIGTGEHRDHLGRFYSFYTVDEVTSELHANGLAVTWREEGREKGLAGTVDPFLLIQAAKHG